jgi:hypothetical protein
MLNYTQALGENRIKASGRYAANDSTSSIRRSWLGLRSIVPRTSSPPKDQSRQLDIGERSPTKSTPTYANGASTAISKVSCRLMAQNDSMLLMPLVGFLPATDPRVRNTVRAIEKRLMVKDEFVLRYERANPGDGLPPGEGAFLACSFWLVDNYILQGRHLDARNSIVSWRVAMTCSPRNTIRSPAACWVIFRKPTAMWV